MTAPASAGLEALMDAAWPATDRQDTGAWVFRAADGVTQRANSIWPRREPDTAPHATPAPHASPAPHDTPALLRDARAWYRGRRLPVIFQVFENAHNAPLNALLDAEGFTRQSETLILVRGAGGGADAEPDPAVELSAQPTTEWLQLWWTVDGRGGGDALATARAILEGCPSVYALVRDDDGVPAAVGRLALVPRAVEGGRPSVWGGLYCMATRPDARRQGHGTRILQALLAAGAARGLDGYWLLVTAANHGAQELYAQAGFQESGRYVYRQERPKRHLTGC